MSAKQAPPLSPCYTLHSGGVRLAVRLQPKASAERVIGIVAEANDGAALKLAVTAAPENGKANAALVKLLARVLDLPARNFTIALGTADRRKMIDITGDPQILARRMTEKLGTWPQPK